jgi:CubicO group peptidase (beta-lactamase class C family)
MRSRTLLLSFACIAIASGIALSGNTLDARITRVENGLLPPVVIQGEPVPTASLDARMEALNIPGLSLAVFHNGRIEWTRGYGMADIAAGRRVTPSTRFQAASISKPVAAVAALALVDRGLLSLDDDVNRYLTSWKVPSNGFTSDKAVTLRGLLTHSAGLTVHGFRGYARGEPVPTLVQVLRGETPANSLAVVVDIPVGSRWRYSGGGFSLLQLLVEDVTGKPFDQAARELVLEPFGMDQSTFAQPLSDRLRRHAATGYRAGRDPIAGGWHTYPEQAAAGLWTTPRDLARFAIELQRIAAGRSQRVLTSELAGEMLRPQLESWGLGVEVAGNGPSTRFSHGGANEGFRCFVVAYRHTGSGVAIMTNADTGGAILEDVVRAVAHEYGWRDLGPVERTLGTANPARYPDFAGQYTVGARRPAGVVRIHAEHGRLFMRLGAGRVELLPENATTFFMIESDVRIEFLRGDDGRVTSARISQGAVDRIATKSE